MIDHAQAKIRLIDAAIKVAEQVESELLFDAAGLACLKQLKRAVLDFKETKQPKRIDESEDDFFDSLHGCG